MQTIIMYLRADSVNAQLVDSYNQVTNSLPALTRGLRAKLILKLLDAEGAPVTDNLTNMASWDFVIADDWNTATAPQIRVSEGITVSGNEVHIPLTETNTEELISALGSLETKNFGCELAGFEQGETSPGYLLQFNIAIRNRRGDAGTGSPVPVSDGNYSAAQIRALFAAKLEVEFSTDGTTWGSEQSQSSRFYRFRNALAGQEWSDPLPCIIGPQGDRSTLKIGSVTTLAPGESATASNSGDEHDAIFDLALPQGVQGDAATIKIGTVTHGAEGDAPEVRNSGDENNAVLDFVLPPGNTGSPGIDSYLYTAYAATADGQQFSLVPGNYLKYRAEIITHTPIETPVSGDFINAQWVKYIGDDGVTQGAILATDQNVTVTNIKSIVFENATIREGEQGEVIVNFPDPAVISHNYSVLNGRTRLSAWINGGGSASGGLTIFFEQETIEPVSIWETHSNFIGEQ